MGHCGDLFAFCKDHTDRRQRGHEGLESPCACDGGLRPVTQVPLPDHVSFFAWLTHIAFQPCLTRHQFQDPRPYLDDFRVVAETARDAAEQVGHSWRETAFKRGASGTAGAQGLLRPSHTPAPHVDPLVNEPSEVFDLPACRGVTPTAYLRWSWRRCATAAAAAALKAVCSHMPASLLRPLGEPLITCCTPAQHPKVATTAPTVIHTAAKAQRTARKAAKRTKWVWKPTWWALGPVRHLAERRLLGAQVGATGEGQGGT